MSRSLSSLTMAAVITSAIAVIQALPGTAVAANLPPMAAAGGSSQPPPGIPPVPPLPVPAALSGYPLAAGSSPLAPTFASPNQGTDQCEVKATGLSVVPGGSHGEAYGSSENYCTNAVSWQQLFTTIESYWTSDNSWHVEKTTSTPERQGGIYIYGSAEFPCNFNATRAWADVAQGYAELQGKLYGDQQTIYNNLSCVG